MEKWTMPDRRDVLKGVGTVGVAAIAGCSQVGEVRELVGDETEPRPEGPAPVVEHYFTAIQNEDVEAANQVVYPDSPAYPIEEDDISYDAEINEINEVEERSTREIAQFLVAEREQQPTEEQIDETVTELEQTNEERINKYGVDDATLVYISYVLDGEEEEQVEAVIQNGGTWYIPALIILGL
jgi:hypothetical protein